MNKKMSKLPKDLNECLNSFSKNIKSKFDHAFNGTCKSILPFKRVSRNSRISLPYRVVIENNLDIEMLMEFEGNVVILLENEDYFNLLDKTDSLSKLLIHNIGGDNEISSLICIHSVNGNSDSTELLKIWKRFEIISKEKGWFPVKRKENQEGTVTKYNYNIEGHFYAKIRGGNNKTLIKFPNTEESLFNIFSDYGSEKVILKVKYQLLYFMLHCYDIETYIKDAKKHILFLKDLVDTTLINVCIIDNVLYCPITCTKLSIEQFDETHKNSVQMSHQEAVMKNKIYYNDEIVTAFRPDNLFWATKNGNMKMQDFTIEEYHKEQKMEAQRKLELDLMKLSI